MHSKIDNDVLEQTSISKYTNCLTGKQRELLDWVWKQSWPLGYPLWVECFDTYVEFGGKDKTITAISEIGGSYIRDGERGEENKPAYCLTTLGILACPSFKCQILPAIKLIDYIRDRAENPSELPMSLSDNEVEEIAGLNDETKFVELKEFFRRSSSLSSLVYPNNEKWCVKKEDPVLKLMAADSAESFLNDCITGKYDPEAPAHETDRQKRGWESAAVDKKKLLILIIRYLSLDQSLYKQISLQVKISSILILITVSGVVSIVTNLLSSNQTASMIAFLAMSVVFGTLGWVQDFVKEKRLAIEKSVIHRVYRKRTGDKFTKFLSKSDQSMRMITDQREAVNGYSGLWNWSHDILGSEPVDVNLDELLNVSHRKFGNVLATEDLSWCFAMNDAEEETKEFGRNKNTRN